MKTAKHLRLVTPETEPTRDYRDWLAANRKSRDWIFAPTQKRAGELVVTSKGFERVEEFRATASQRPSS